MPSPSGSFYDNEEGNGAAVTGGEQPKTADEMEEIDPDSEEYQPVKVTSKVAYWFTIASANGFNRLVEAKQKIRIFWMLVIFVCYVCMVVHLSFNFRQFFEFGADTNIDFQTEKVEVPDITICRVGLTIEVHNADEKIGIAELAFKLAYTHLSGFDKMRQRSSYFARASFYRQKNFSREHIGQYLLNCNYRGDECDFRNFTLYRDPLFTNCFTFTPTVNQRQLSNSGMFLNLGLFTDPTLTKHDPDYLIVLHERGTRPDILHDHFLVRAGGITELTLKIDKITLHDRPYARCFKNKTVEYLFTQRPSSTFHYTKMDCFWKHLHDIILKNCGCSNPLSGVRPEWKNQKECFVLPSLTPGEMEYINYYKLKKDAQFGKVEWSEVPKLSPEIQLLNVSAKRKLKSMQNEMACFHKYYKVLAQDYSDTPCKHPCERKQITTWRTFNFFRSEQITLIQEFMMPNKSVRLRTTARLAERSLNNNMSRDMLQFANMLRDDFWEAGKRKGRDIDDKKLKKLVFERMAMATLYIQKVPGDSIYETMSYPFFSLLSDIGGNSGLWAGFSVISLFEFFELIFMVIGGYRKKRRVQKYGAAAVHHDKGKTKPAADGKKAEKGPAAAEVPMLPVTTSEKEATA